MGGLAKDIGRGVSSTGWTSNLFYLIGMGALHNHILISSKIFMYNSLRCLGLIIDQ